MDEGALIKTYREQVHPLYEYVSRWCGGDRSLAEDVTQEVWLRAVRDWRGNGIPTNPLAWLRVVARNLLLNNSRRIKPRSLESMPEGWDPGSSDQAFHFDSPDHAALVNWGLARLRPRQARLLEAFHFDGRKTAEIAAELRVSVRAVEGRLRRAREKLRKQLESLDGSEGGLI
jgi:RNA polymerase sigma-70 factor (ECF subfamily)